MAFLGTLVGALFLNFGAIGLMDASGHSRSVSYGSVVLFGAILGGVLFYFPPSRFRSFLWRSGVLVVVGISGAFSITRNEGRSSLPGMIASLVIPLILLSATSYWLGHARARRRTKAEAASPAVNARS